MTTRVYAHPTSLGDVVLQATFGDDGQPQSVEIVSADPRVLIDGELVRRTYRGEGNPTVPFAEVDKPEVGGVLRIRAANRTLVYRLTEYEPLFELHGPRIPDVFTGEWPD